MTQAIAHQQAVADLLAFAGPTWIRRREAAQRNGSPGAGRAFLARWARAEGWTTAEGKPASQRAVREVLAAIDEELQKEAAGDYISPLRAGEVREVGDLSAPSVLPEVNTPAAVRSAGGQAVKVDTIDTQAMEDGIRASGTALGKMLLPEEIAERIGIDPDMYEAVVVKVKHWSGFMAGPDRQPMTVPLFSYSVEFKRREVPFAWRPEAINVNYVPAPKCIKHGTQRALFIGDMHFGYRWEDARCNKLVPMMNLHALDVILQYISLRRPDYIFFMGDDLDNPESGRHAHSSLFRGTLTASAHSLLWAYGAVRAAAGPAATIVKIPGNHDVRTTRALDVSHPELAAYVPAESPYVSTGFRSLMGPAFDALNIQIAEHGQLGAEHGAEWWLWADEANVPTHVTHGSQLGSGMRLAQKMLDLPGAFHRVCGHVHKQFVAYRKEPIAGMSRTADIAAFCPGTLAYCDKRVPAQNSGKGYEEWQYGLAEQVLDESTGRVSTHVYPIVNGERMMLPEGGMLVGRDLAPIISTATGIRAING